MTNPWGVLLRRKKITRKIPMKKYEYDIKHREAKGIHCNILSCGGS